MHWGRRYTDLFDRRTICSFNEELKDHFTIADNAEVSIEMDPREIELNMLDHLRNIGFNRISMGVQDFNKAVQKAVNREQDEEFVNALLVRAR